MLYAYAAMHVCATIERPSAKRVLSGPCSGQSEFSCLSNPLAREQLINAISCHQKFELRRASLHSRLSWGVRGVSVSLSRFFKMSFDTIHAQHQQPTLTTPAGMTFINRLVPHV